MTSTAPTPAALRRYTLFVAASTLFLIFAGAMVTSTGSGLAVPDWPLSYGMIMPPMVGGIFYEHGHRMIAATVGFLTVLQAIFLQVWEPKRFIRRLGWAAVGAVIAQGVLGGLTVIFLLPKAISISHAGLAEIFFCLNVSIAFFTRRPRAGASVGQRGGGLQPVPGPAEAGPHVSVILSREDGEGSVPLLAPRLLVALVYTQILIGALMRHLGAGLAIPDFPLSFGKVVPAFTSLAIAVNYAHRVGAAVVACAILYVAAKVPRYRWMLVGVVLMQLTLGAFTVWSGKHPILTSFHVAGGALTLAVSLITALGTRATAKAPALRLLPTEATA
ncbi:MAG: heme A synthase [Acidobacteria bacterium]|nr:heme A synthase [Acidobacteriota bacterium]